MKPLFYKDKVVVITGGSSGIGLALAKEFAAQAAKLVLIARDLQKLQAAKASLEKVGSATVLVLDVDVSRKEEIMAAINKLGAQYGKIDLLICCAGIITCGRFADQPVEDLELCHAINYFGTVYTTKAAWPWLKKAGGQLGLVSSVAGYIGLIGYSSYAPSKFALTGLAECLWMEGIDDGIRISILYPPDTDTPLLEYEHKHTLPESKALSKHIKAKTPEAVARVFLVGLIKNKFEIYCDGESRLLRWFKNNFPFQFRYLTKRTIQKSRKVSR
jgi:3-dehydrosphinganine reductase